MKYQHAGIDFSMTCPAITLGNIKDYKDYSKCKSFYYTNKKKFEGVFNKNIYGMMSFPYDSEMERFNNISDWVMSILNEFSVESVTIEGYSMGSKGRVFHIAENTGILKYKMWLSDTKYNSPAPTSVKKHFSGKGNSGKEDMHNAFIEKTGIDISNIMSQNADSNPTSDIVDSYAMLCYGIENYCQ